MRSALFAATAFFSLAAIRPAALAADAPYVDDRSDAAAVIRSLYSAINRQEFARAWDYFGDTKPAKDFDAFVKGYDGTEKVEVKTGGVSRTARPAASTTMFRSPSGRRTRTASENVFAGCYTLRQVNASIQEPPFRPIFIDKGALKPSKAEFEDAVPASCGDGTAAAEERCGCWSRPRRRLLPLMATSATSKCLAASRRPSRTPTRLHYKDASAEADSPNARRGCFASSARWLPTMRVPSTMSTTMSSGRQAVAVRLAGARHPL